MSNNCIGKSREHPEDATEASRQLEHYRPMCFAKRKTDEDGEQHLMKSGDGGKVCSCFRCGRAKPECPGARNCNCEKKADGSNANPQEAVDALFKEQKEVGGTQHVMEGDPVPSWTDMLADERSHDGNTMLEWSFVQNGLLGKYQLDHANKELIYDASNESEHAHNQAGTRSDVKERLWRLSLDSQSTCNVIVNKDLLHNIRKCNWTLRLQTQVGECCIDQIGEMRGAGTVWYYKDGAANILSQFMMALRSGWDINCSTKAFKRTGNIDDLCFHVKTGNGFKCKFAPTSKGLHAYKIDKSACRNVFGSKESDSSIKGTCYDTLGLSRPRNERGVQFAGVDAVDELDAGSGAADAGDTGVIQSAGVDHIDELDNDSGAGDGEDVGNNQSIGADDGSNVNNASNEVSNDDGN